MQPSQRFFGANAGAMKVKEAKYKADLPLALQLRLLSKGCQK